MTTFSFKPSNNVANISLGANKSGLRGNKIVVKSDEKKKKKKDKKSKKTKPIQLLEPSEPDLTPEVFDDEMMDEMDEMEEAQIKPPNLSKFTKFANKDKMKKSPKKDNSVRMETPFPTITKTIKPVSGPPKAMIPDDDDFDNDEYDDEMPDFHYKRKSASSKQPSPTRKKGSRQTQARVPQLEHMSDDYDSYEDDEDPYYDDDMSESMGSYMDQRSLLSSVSGVRQHPKPEYPQYRHVPTRRRDPFFEENPEDAKAMEEAEKADILNRLNILRQKGISLSKKFTEKSTLTELRMEIGRLERERQVANAILVQQRGLMVSVAGIEKLVTKFAPVGKFKDSVSGVSKYIHTHLDDYSGAFERLTEHYEGSIGRVLKNPWAELVAVFARHIFEYTLNSDKNDMTAEEILQSYPNEIKQIATDMAKDIARQIIADEREKMWQEFRSFGFNPNGPVMAPPQPQQTTPQYYNPNSAQAHHMFQETSPFLPPMPPMPPPPTQSNNNFGIFMPPARPNVDIDKLTDESRQQGHFEIVEQEFGRPETMKVIESLPTSMNTRKGHPTKVRTIRKVDANGEEVEI